MVSEGYLPAIFFLFHTLYTPPSNLVMNGSDLELILSNGFAEFESDELLNIHRRLLHIHDRLLNTHDRISNTHNRILETQRKLLGSHCKLLDVLGKLLDGHEKLLDAHDNEHKGPKFTIEEIPRAIRTIFLMLLPLYLINSYVSSENLLSTWVRCGLGAVYGFVLSNLCFVLFLSRESIIRRFKAKYTK